MERYGFRNLPRTVRASCPVKKRERAGPTENPPLPALYTARDRKLAGMMTGALPDCGPWPGPGRTYPTLGWSVLAVKPNGRGCLQGSAAIGLLTKKSIWMSKVMSEVQKDSEDVSAGIGNIKSLI